MAAIDTMVATSETKKQSRVGKWGWGILLAISALLIFYGVMWYSTGPSISLDYIEQGGGVPMDEFRQAYPEAVAHMVRNMHQEAVWFLAFGLMASIVSLEGFRHGTRWAWNATWGIVVVFTLVGLVYTIGVGQLAFDNVGMFFFAAIALVGQLLARQGLVS